MPDPILQIKDLHVGYNARDRTVLAVRGIDFEIGEGEVFGLVGESGSGKSSVAMAAMNYLGPNGRARGQVIFRGRDILSMPAAELRELRGGKIAMVYQDPMSALNPSIPVGAQIGESLQIHRRASRAEAGKAAIRMMERLQIPDAAINAHKYVHQLSGGMQQRAVIAMALICEPDLLILDEPTTALDVTTEATILDLILDLRRDYGAAILFITHDLGVIARVSDRMAVLYAGELVETGATAAVFDRPRHPYTLALLGAIPRSAAGGGAVPPKPIPGRLPDQSELPTGCIFSARCEFVHENCLQAQPPLRVIAGSQSAACFHAEGLPPPTVSKSPLPASERPARGLELIGVRHLEIRFGEHSLLDALRGRAGTYVPAVNGVDLTISRHETVGLVGESGSGKTTMGKGLAGLVPLSGGEVLVDGQPRADLSRGELRALRRRVQFIFQNPESSLNPRKRVGEIVARPLKLYGLARGARLRPRVLELLELVQLRPDYADRYPHELSGGEKQRVGIARAFAAEPDLIIADEPLSALDVSVQAAILSLLADLQARFETAYLFISHDLNVVRSLCDRVNVMYLGNLYEVGSAEQVFSPPYHPYTEALLSAIPIPDPRVRQERIRLQGPLPSPRHPPSGCRFHTRCPRIWGDICKEEMPPPQQVAPGHLIYCHRPLDTLGQPVVEGID